MADTQKAANTAVKTSGDTAVTDRVAMLSLNKDGSPDQVNPEVIGNKDFAVAAAKRQFAEQAVSAADDAARVAAALEAADASTVKQDPTIAELQKEHEKVASAAEKRAESVVGDLHQG